MISWTRESLTLSPSNSSNPGVLELPRVELRDQGLYVCQAQHPLGSKKAFLNLVVRSELEHTWGKEAGVPGRGKLP